MKLPIPVKTDRAEEGGRILGGEILQWSNELLHCFDNHDDNQHDHQAADHDGIYDKDKMGKAPEPNGLYL